MNSFTEQGSRSYWKIGVYPHRVGQKMLLNPRGEDRKIYERRGKSFWFPFTLGIGHTIKSKRMSENGILQEGLHLYQRSARDLGRQKNRIHKSPRCTVELRQSKFWQIWHVLFYFAESKRYALGHCKYAGQTLYADTISKPNYSDSTYRLACASAWWQELCLNSKKIKIRHQNVGKQDQKQAIASIKSSKVKHDDLEFSKWW